ncbi:thioesterase domain-containing protein, partial [Cribrihabitans sp. XS_ASV171]
RQVQPEGPYMLGGYSGGGITAFEMAHQLEAAGESVAVVAMIDTPLPVRPSLSRQDKALIKMHEFRRKGPGYLAEWARNRLAWEVERRKAPPPDNGVAAFNNLKIETAFREAIAAYQVTPWDGRVVLFRPPLDRYWQVSGGQWVSRLREYVFDDNDWRRFVPDTEVVEVPGNHNSMVLVPNVSVLAEHLKSVLDSLDTAPKVRRAAE